MPIGSLTHTKNTCRYHARERKPDDEYRVITLSQRKGLMALIAGTKNYPYSRKKSHIITVIAKLNKGKKGQRQWFSSCEEALPTLKHIGKRAKVN